MVKRLPGDLYAELTAAGFDAQAAVTLTAIAGAESGYSTTALGDQTLENTTWGPSYGLFQVRTVKGDTGTGGDRDISALSSGDAAQIQAAYDISHGGTDFSPWSTYTSGKYQQFLPTAQTAAGAGGAVLTAAGGPAPTWGPSWLPWNWPSNAVNSAYSSGLAGARAITLEAAFVILGLALVAGGLAVAVAPTAGRISRQAAAAGARVAKVAL